MMKELVQTDYPLQLIEDLGLRPYKHGNKRFAIFKCQDCDEHIEANTYDVKRGKIKRCKSCRTKFKSKPLNDDIQTHKQCGTCKDIKPIDNFFNSSASKDGKGTRCKSCDLAARYKWTADNPERSKESNRRRAIRHKYGIELEDYDNLLKSQDNKCAICSTTFNGGKSFSIDHCHQTGTIRGLLCNQCNRGIGMLGDTAEALLKAYKYLVNTLK